MRTAFNFDLSPTGATAPNAYACHYCGRANGLRTKDHKIPRIFGGKGGQNIVRCCMMCNMVKSARDYALFVLLFREFLDEHGEEYRTADPDDFRTIGRMHKKFDTWLRAQQELPRGAEASGA